MVLVSLILRDRLFVLVFLDGKLLVLVLVVLEFLLDPLAVAFLLEFVVS